MVPKYAYYHVLSSDSLLTFFMLDDSFDVDAYKKLFKVMYILSKVLKASKLSSCMSVLTIGSSLCKLFTTKWEALNCQHRLELV